MDLHQIGTGLGIGSYAQQEQQQQSSTLTTTSTTTPSSSVSPSTTQRPQHFQQHQHQHQLYNLLPPQPHGSYSTSISSWPHSRDLLHQQQQQQQLYQPQQSSIKREIMGKHLDTGNGSKNADDSMPSTSDFVKKLYKFVPFSFFSPFVLFEYRFFFFFRRVSLCVCRMLEDPSFQNVVSWGPSGDCFVVKVCVFLLISYTILPVSFSYRI